jgi:hypothetical protein
VVRSERVGFRLPSSGRWVRALALVYLPQLAPLLFGPLTECSHCVGTYWQLFGVLPGALVAALLAQELGWFGWIPVVILVLGVWATAFALVRAPWTRARRIAAALLAALLAANALAFGTAIRM